MEQKLAIRVAMEGWGVGFWWLEDGFKIASIVSFGLKWRGGGEEEEEEVKEREEGRILEMGRRDARYLQRGRKRDILNVGIHKR